MSKITRASIAIIALVLMAVLFFRQGPSESALIRKQFDTLVKHVQKTTPTQKLAETLEQASKISELVATPFTVDSGDTGYGYRVIKSNGQIKKKVIAGLRALRTIEVSAYLGTIEVKDDRAVSECTVNILGSLKTEEGQFFDQHLVETTFKKGSDGTWRLEKITHKENLRGDEEN